MDGIWVLRLLGMVFAIMGVGFIAAGRAVCAGVKKRKTCCTQKVTAKVAEVRKEKEYVCGEVRYSWYSVYEYTVNGKEVRKRDQTGSSKPRFKLGQQVCLYVNPDNIEQYYCSEEKEEQLGRIFSVVGAGIFLLAIVVAIVGFMLF